MNDKAFQQLVASCPGTNLGTMSWQDFLTKFVDKGDRGDKNARSLNDLMGGIQGRGV